MYTGTRIGTDNPFYGQTHTEATKQKISAIHKGRKKGPLSEETKLKISQAKKGQIPWNKKNKS